MNDLTGGKLLIGELLLFNTVHFRSMQAPQNKSYVTNRLSDRNCILAVCTRFIRKCSRFEVIRDFRSLNHGGNQFPVDGSIARQT
jgi:hypothetical protein